MTLLKTAQQEDSVKTATFQLLKSDLTTTQKRSNQNLLEVLSCSPGLQALFLHRGAYWLQIWRIPLLPRLISVFKRFLTGIEIHPGAKIGKGVLICHGLGVVIDETAIVGDGTVIYQDVTLGGTGKETGKRHPTLGKNVIVEPGAKILGNIKIGDNVRICAGSVVLQDVPDNSLVAGIPGRIIYSGFDAESQSNTELQLDWQAQVIQNLFKRIKFLEKEIESLRSTPESLLTRPQTNSQTDSDRLIEEFLDGAGM
ncbi:MAG: serine O-acetyltransferase EpsC [Chroococcidiopsis sp.]